MSPSIPFIIAEMSGNHNGQLKHARDILLAAKEAGADAIKLQTYTADTMTIPCDNEYFQVRGGLWDGHTLHELYQKAATPWEWHRELFDLAHSIGLTIFSTPFDVTAVDFLEKLGNPIYKIASFEVIDLALIRYVAQIGKPMIMSTGMAQLDEIREAVETAQKSGCKDLTLMHCVSSYPASIEESNLATLVDLKRQFRGISIGISDHSMGTTVAIAAVALGACCIEKHFTLRRSDGGVDSAFSLEPTELWALGIGARDARAAVGKIDYELTEQEKNNLVFRRSLFAVKNIRAGEEFTNTNIRCIRPGHGLAPKYLPQILGCRAISDIERGSPLNWALIQK